MTKKNLTSESISSCAPVGNTIYYPVDGEDFRRFFLSRRQTLLMELGAIEDLLRLPRTRPPKKKATGGKD